MPWHCTEVQPAPLLRVVLAGAEYAFFGAEYPAGALPGLLITLVAAGAARTRFKIYAGPVFGVMMSWSPLIEIALSDIVLKVLSNARPRQLLWLLRELIVRNDSPILRLLLPTAMKTPVPLFSSNRTRQLPVEKMPSSGTFACPETFDGFNNRRQLNATPIKVRKPIPGIIGFIGADNF